MESLNCCDSESNMVRYTCTRNLLTDHLETEEDVKSRKNWKSSGAWLRWLTVALKYNGSYSDNLELLMTVG